jgi:hypothetical protein
VDFFKERACVKKEDGFVEISKFALLEELAAFARDNGKENDEKYWIALLEENGFKPNAWIASPELRKLLIEEGEPLSKYERCGLW